MKSSGHIFIAFVYNSLASGYSTKKKDKKYTNNCVYDILTVKRSCFIGSFILSCTALYIVYGYVMISYLSYSCIIFIIILPWEKISLDIYLIFWSNHCLCLWIVGPVFFFPRKILINNTMWLVQTLDEFKLKGCIGEVAPINWPSISCEIFPCFRRKHKVIWKKIQ